HAATNKANSTAPIKTTGEDCIGIRNDELLPNKGANNVPIQKIIAKRFRNPAVNDIVATYRYLATRTLARDVAVVITVSQVEFSRSPAVDSMAGCMPPTASMMVKQIGSTITNALTSRPVERSRSSIEKFWNCAA